MIEHKKIIAVWVFVIVSAVFGVWAVQEYYFKQNIKEQGGFVYRNDQIGFEMKFPERWRKMKTQTLRDDYYGGYVVIFEMPSRDDGIYRSACDITYYSNDSWEKFQNDDTTGKPTLLYSINGFKFGHRCGHDDYGFVGFEDYNNDVDNNEFNTLSSQTPYGEFREAILPTFKFIGSTADLETSTWKTYRNEEYGFEFKYPIDWEYFISPPGKLEINQGSSISFNPIEEYDTLDDRVSFFVDRESYLSLIDVSISDGSVTLLDVYSKNVGGTDWTISKVKSSSSHFIDRVDLVPVVEKGGFYFRFMAELKDEALLSQILSTFKFIQ